MRSGRAISRQPRQPRRPRLARRHCRGLGLFDALLGVILLSMLALVGGQIAGTWVDRQLMAGEARALAGLARAGRLWVEGDNAPALVRGILQGVSFIELRNERMWGENQIELTPGRKRTMTLRLWLADTDRVMVIARARGASGSAIPPGVPGAAAAVPGVGAIPERPPGHPDELRLSGPDLDFDMRVLNAVQPGFAQRGDLFALAHVYTEHNCDAYLHRDTDPDCPEATRMSTDLDMGGNDLIAIDEIVADAVRIGTIIGDLSIEGGLEISDALSVGGHTTLFGDLVVSGAARVDGTLSVGADLLVAGDLTATGTVSGGALVFEGDLSVAGTASLGAVRADDLIAGTVTAQTVFGDTGEFRNLHVEELTVTGCNGCEP